MQGFKWLTIQDNNLTRKRRPKGTERLRRRRKSLRLMRRIKEVRSFCSDSPCLDRLRRRWNQPALCSTRMFSQPGVCPHAVADYSEFAFSHGSRIQRSRTVSQVRTCNCSAVKTRRIESIVSSCVSSFVFVHLEVRGLCKLHRQVGRFGSGLTRAMTRTGFQTGLGPIGR